MRFELDYGQKLPIAEWLGEKNNNYGNNEEILRVRIIKHFNEVYRNKEEHIGTVNMRYLEKLVYMHVLDSHWKEHLATMEYMRQSIHLRGYAQKDPKQEYKKEAFML